MSDFTNLPSVATNLDEIVDLAIMGLMTDGAYHKQWYFEQILIRLGFDLKELKQELNAGGCDWEEGIAP